MINITPTQPNCITATQLRMEFEQSDIDIIAEHLGMTSDELLEANCKDNKLAEWALDIIFKWFTERELNTNRLTFTE